MKISRVGLDIASKYSKCARSMNTGKFEFVNSWLEQKFAASFAADVEKGRAEFMAKSQVPWGVAAVGGPVSAPAWKSKPSWYLVAIDDKMIPPAAQRAMSKRGRSSSRSRGVTRFTCRSPRWRP